MKKPVKMLQSDARLFLHEAKFLHKSLRFRIMASESIVKHSDILRTAFGKDVFPERISHFLVENAFLLEKGESICLEDFRPLV